MFKHAAFPNKLFINTDESVLIDQNPSGVRGQEGWAGLLLKTKADL